MKINNWKSTQSLLSLSDYRKFYATIAELPSGEKHSAIHNLLINLSNVCLNPDHENDNFLIAKNGYRYSAEMDNWSIGELAKVKNLLAELKELGIPDYSNTNRRTWESETNFLAFLKMECTLRYRPLLANSWRVEQR